MTICLGIWENRKHRIDIKCKYIHLFMMKYKSLNMLNFKSVKMVCNLWANFSEYHLQIEEKSEVRDEKPNNNNIHSAGTHRRPWATGSDFYLSISHLHTECNWKPDHHHAHLCGFPSQNTHVLFLKKFLLLGDLIHNCLCS